MIEDGMTQDGVIQDGRKDGMIEGVGERVADQFFPRCSRIFLCISSGWKGLWR